MRSFGLALPALGTAVRDWPPGGCFTQRTERTAFSLVAGKRLLSVDYRSGVFKSLAHPILCDRTKGKWLRTLRNTISTSSIKHAAVRFLIIKVASC